jgi:TPP-dependent pyruvate/acetoin dehydrogenase alpha subunit
MTSKSKEQRAAAPASAASNGFSLISNEKLHGLYAAMLKCRMLAERSHSLIRQNKVSGKKGAKAGREAAAVGVAIDLRPDDTIVPLSGDPIQYVIHSLPLVALFSSVFKQAVPSPVMGARLKAAIDAVVANKNNKNKNIAVAFSAKDSSPWREALRFAGVHGLPMIFVSWNAPPPELPTADSQARVTGARLKTRAYSLPAITVDGNDAVAVYRVAHEAIAHARMGDGPSLIECQTDGVDLGDPILNMERYLAGKGLFTEGFKAEVTDRFRRELEAAIESAQGSPTQKRPRQLTGY